MVDDVVLYIDNTCGSVSNGSKWKAPSLESYKETVWGEEQRRILEELCPIYEQWQASFQTVSLEAHTQVGPSVQPCLGILTNSPMRPMEAGWWVFRFITAPSLGPAGSWCGGTSCWGGDTRTRPAALLWREQEQRPALKPESWKEGQLVVAPGRKQEDVMFCRGSVTAELLDTIYEFWKPLHNHTQALRHHQRTGRVLYSLMLTLQFLQWSFR